MEKGNKKIVKGNIKLSQTNNNNKTIKMIAKEDNRSKELIAATAQAVVKLESDVKMIEKQTEKVIRKVLMLEGTG
jgi:Cd2+/Zn2+-exporting ATPase